MSRLILNDANNSSSTREQQFTRTELLPGTWCTFTYSGVCTKEQIREYFVSTLGMELEDARISLSRGKFTISFDRLALAELIRWILDSSQYPNPNHIEVAPPRE